VKTIYLSLGSNLGNRESHLRDAIGRLDSPDLRVLRISPVYETEPVGFAGQGWFLNLVAEAETTLFPLRLLQRTSRIERELGRVRTVAQGPRTIDIDILLYGGAVIRTPRLEVPHPRMAERRFVLAPLADISPDLDHPILHRTIAQLLREAPEQRVRLLHSEFQQCKTSTQP
jgi:2-amino-4-hydroxy-6-hydroxymethyldihydropteridine diphosphokinase